MKWKKNRRLHVLLFLLVIFSLTVLSVAMAFAATGDKKDVTCGTFWPPEEGYYVRRNSSGIVNGMMNVIAVSYTHLDVYKRQVLGCDA